ncbi:Ig-like domain-containing protein [Listeria monocytogenes]|uniref:Ig-like domain-containing protein n=1 Tax=Listeria monocytogenes TaxID=1639 RepID=UPI001F426E8E|nr:Ig-like domain-containing protein [Listeria monocytogenes]
MDNEPITVVLGGTVTINALVLPTDANQDMTFTSSNQNRIKVSEIGVVEGVSMGIASITIRSSVKPSVTKKVIVTVEPTE